MTTQLSIAAAATFALIGASLAPAVPAGAAPTGAAGERTQLAMLQHRGGGGGAHAPRAGGNAGSGRAASGHANQMQVRDSSRMSVNHGTNVNRNANVNRNTNVNRNVNVNNNVNVNVHGGGGCCYGNDWDDDHDFGVGLAVGAVTGAVVGAAVANNNNSSTTTVVVTPGTVVTALPSGCSTTVVNNVTYSQCGSVWYQPQYAGNTVQYVVVSQP